LFVSTVENNGKKKNPRNAEILTSELKAFIKSHDGESLQDAIHIVVQEQAVAKFLCAIATSGKLDALPDLPENKKKKLDSRPTPDEGGSGNDSSAPIDEELTFQDVLKMIKDMTPGAKFTLMRIDKEIVGDDNYALVKKVGAEDFITDSNQSARCLGMMINLGTETYTLVFDQTNGTVSRKKLECCLLAIHAISVTTPTKEDVHAALYTRTVAIRNLDQKKLAYVDGLVQKEPANFEPTFVSDLSKAQVFVVAGESGSGKSTYANNLFKNDDDCVMLRHSVIDDDLESNPKPSETLDGVTPDLREFVELVTRELFDQGLVETQVYKSMRSVSSSINQERNKWALTLAEKMLQQEAAGIGTGGVSRWYDRKEGGDKITLNKLVLVFDECGKSPDFTVGLIASARNLLIRLHKKKLATEMALVMCGSGLEAVKTGTTGNKYIGSDPALTDVVVMKFTDLSKLADKSLRQSIGGGVYSRFLATNARMLVHGILPTLEENDLVVMGPEDSWSDLETRRIAFGSFRFAMDICVRVYVKLNVLASMDMSSRTVLLNASFQYMLRSALLNLRSSDEAKLLIETLQQQTIEEDLFRIGLATRDLSRTSSALKYLACNGKTAPLYSANGVAFEVLVAAHLHRYLETLGCMARIEDLRFAWPPATEKNAVLGEENIDDRMRILKNTGKADVDMIVDYFKKRLHVEHDVALVLRQGVPNAQGADLLQFILKQHDGVRAVRMLEVSIFQAKNWKSQKFEGVMNKAAQSIGVDTYAYTNTPTKGYAGYYYQATMTLCKEVVRLANTGVEDDMKFDFKLKSRVIVFAYSHDKISPTDCEDIKLLGVQLWSKEMLEPTISSMLLADTDTEELVDAETE
jgi:hypothetical protein